MKASPVLFYLRARYVDIHPAKRAVIEWFFGAVLRGMDRKHHARLMRLFRDIREADVGEGFQLYVVRSRSGPYHRMHRAMLARIFESQEEFDEEDALHDWFKFACYFVEWQEGPITGRPIPVPRSTNFDDCSEDEMREFHNRIVDKLHEPATQELLWPSRSPEDRAAWVAHIINPEEQPE